MCREIERVNEIFGALGDIEKHACRNRRTGDTCPFYETCGYQRQKQATPQVWLIPHELLFHQRPAFIPAPAVLGIDKSFWGSSLQGTENPITVDASDLTSDRTVPGPGVFNSADLTETSRRVHEAITGHGDGYIRRDTLIRAGLTADDLRNAQRLEWRRKLSLDDVLPGMPRREAIRLCRKVKERNRVVGRLARLWDLLARQLEGELDVSPWVERRADEDGEPVVYMAWRRDINESWSAPTVVMDATMQPAIVRRSSRRLASRSASRRRCRMSACGRSPTGRWRRDAGPRRAGKRSPQPTRRNNVERVRRSSRSARMLCAGPGAGRLPAGSRSRS